MRLTHSLKATGFNPPWTSWIQSTNIAWKRLVSINPWEPIKWEDGFTKFAFPSKSSTCTAKLVHKVVNFVPPYVARAKNVVLTPEYDAWMAKMGGDHRGPGGAGGGGDYSGKKSSKKSKKRKKDDSSDSGSDSSSSSSSSGPKKKSKKEKKEKKKSKSKDGRKKKSKRWQSVPTERA
jgi:hypothetical protein